jgi:hypothetical protein
MAVRRLTMSHAATPLPVIEVQSPCPADWDAMPGDDRARFCAHCQRHVHDLSAMRSDEVADLICRTAGSLCVRFEREADGQVKTLDYAPRRGWRMRYRWLVVGVLAALGAGIGRGAWQRHQPSNIILGGIGPPPLAQPVTTPTSANPAASSTSSTP